MSLIEKSRNLILAASIATSCAPQEDRSTYHSCPPIPPGGGPVTCVEVPSSQYGKETPKTNDSQEVAAAKNYWTALTTGTVDDVFNAMQPEHVGNGRTDSARRKLIQDNIDLYRNCTTGYDDQRTTIQSVQNNRVVTIYLERPCEVPLTGTYMTVRKLVITLGRSADGRYLPNAAPTPLS